MYTIVLNEADNVKVNFTKFVRYLEWLLPVQEGYCSFGVTLFVTRGRRRVYYLSCLILIDVRPAGGTYSVKPRSANLLDFTRNMK